MATQQVDEPITDRAAARLAKHWHQLELSRLEHNRKAGELDKEQKAIAAKLDAFVRATSPKTRVVTLSKFVLSIVEKASTRYISWKGVCTEKLGEAAVAAIEADPPRRDVLVILPATAVSAAAKKGRAA